MKKNNIILCLLGIVVVLLIVLGIAVGTGKLVLTKNDQNIEEKDISHTNQSTSDATEETIDINYNDFVGIWRNDVTQNEFEIHSVDEDELFFTWALYRLTVLENKKIPIQNGEAIFYFQGYDDLNYDSVHTEDEKFIRKATIELTDYGVDVIVEDVNQVNDKYPFFKDYDEGVYIKAGTYTHNNKE